MRRGVRHLDRFGPIRRDRPERTGPRKPRPSFPVGTRLQTPSDTSDDVTYQTPLRVIRLRQGDPLVHEGEELPPPNVDKTEHSLPTGTDLGRLWPSEPGLARVDGRVEGIGPSEKPGLEPKREGLKAPTGLNGWDLKLRVPQGPRWRRHRWIDCQAA